jgi:sugar phosphate permease
LLRFGWRAAFVLLAGIGVVWSAFWLAWFRDRPADHPGLNAAERDLIGEEGGDGDASIDWQRLIREPNLLAILLMYFTYGYTGYIYITWFPTYLIEARGLSVAWTGFMAALPLALGIAAKPLGGYWSDWLTARPLRYGRRMVGFCGFAIGMARRCPACWCRSVRRGAAPRSPTAARRCPWCLLAVCLDVV